MGFVGPKSGGLWRVGLTKQRLAEMIAAMRNTHLGSWVLPVSTALVLTMTLAVPALAQKSGQQTEKSTSQVSIKHLKADGKFRIEIGGELFADYSYEGYRMPVIYPIHGVGGVPMTRGYPMVAGTHDSKDHPHHKSLWFAHGEVNGHDFWHDKKCRVVQDKVVTRKDGNRVTISASNSWLVGEQKICREQRTVSFHVEAAGRFIDYQVKIMATEGPLHFGDTKEGTMAIRTTPYLRLKGKFAAGKAQNSVGQSGKAIWGKRAKWVDYHAPVAEQVVGVAIFDHPLNHGYPCRWHARDYGLVAANPWGVGPFERKKKTAGQRLKKGESVTLRYRFFFHAGDATQAKVEQQWAKFAKSSSRRPTSRPSRTPKRSAGRLRKK